MSAIHSRATGRSGPKTKTGCTTCRRRKVRCDENKPVCANCTRLKLPCGYLGPSQNPPGGQPGSKRARTHSFSSPSSLLTGTPSNIPRLPPPPISVFGHSGPGPSTGAITHGGGGSGVLPEYSQSPRLPSPHQAVANGGHNSHGHHVLHDIRASAGAEAEAGADVFGNMYLSQAQAQAAVSACAWDGSAGELSIASPFQDVFFSSINLTDLDLSYGTTNELLFGSIGGSSGMIGGGGGGNGSEPGNETSGGGSGGGGMGAEIGGSGPISDPSPGVASWRTPIGRESQSQINRPSEQTETRLLEHFTRATNPISVILPTHTEWASACRSLLAMARNSTCLSSSIYALAALHLYTSKGSKQQQHQQRREEEADMLELALGYYQAASAEVTAILDAHARTNDANQAPPPPPPAASSTASGSPPATAALPPPGALRQPSRSSLELKQAFASLFLLSHVEVTAQSTPLASEWPLQHVRTAHARVRQHSDRIQTWAGTSRRLLTWMALLQNKAEYNGGGNPTAAGSGSGSGLVSASAGGGSGGVAGGAGDGGGEGGTGGIDGDLERCSTESSTLVGSTGDPFGRLEEMGRSSGDGAPGMGYKGGRYRDARTGGRDGAGTGTGTDTDMEEVDDPRTPAELACDTMNQPALDFHLRAQSFTPRIIALDKYHHRRGTLETEFEILKAGHVINADLHALWECRPATFSFLADSAGPASLAGLASVFRPAFARVIVRNLRVYGANFWAHFIYLHRVAFVAYPATDDVRRAVAEITRLALDMRRDAERPSPQRGPVVRMPARELRRLHREQREQRKRKLERERDLELEQQQLGRSAVFSSSSISSTRNTTLPPIREYHHHPQSHTTHEDHNAAAATHNGHVNTNTGEERREIHGPQAYSHGKYEQRERLGQRRRAKDMTTHDNDDDHQYAADEADDGKDEETETETDHDEDDETRHLPHTMLWPLFMMGLECPPEDRAWVLETMRQVRVGGVGLPSAAERSAQLLEEVLRRQDASRVRVDHRDVRKELFDSELSVVY